MKKGKENKKVEFLKSISGHQNNTSRISQK